MVELNDLELEALQELVHASKASVEALERAIARRRGITTEQVGSLQETVARLKDRGLVVEVGLWLRPTDAGRDALAPPPRWPAPRVVSLGRDLDPLSAPGLVAAVKRTSWGARYAAQDAGGLLAVARALLDLEPAELTIVSLAQVLADLVQAAREDTLEAHRAAEALDRHMEGATEPFDVRGFLLEVHRDVAPREGARGGVQPWALDLVERHGGVEARGQHLERWTAPAPAAPEPGTGSR